MRVAIFDQIIGSIVDQGVAPGHLLCSGGGVAMQKRPAAKT